MLEPNPDSLTFKDVIYSVSNFRTYPCRIIIDTLMVNTEDQFCLIDNTVGGQQNGYIPAEGGLVCFDRDEQIPISENSTVVVPADTFIEFLLDQSPLAISVDDFQVCYKSDYVTFSLDGSLTETSTLLGLNSSATICEPIAHLPLNTSSGLFQSCSQQQQPENLVCKSTTYSSQQYTSTLYTNLVSTLDEAESREIERFEKEQRAYLERLNSDLGNLNTVVSEEIESNVYANARLRTAACSRLRRRKPDAECLDIQYEIPSVNLEGFPQPMFEYPEGFDELFDPSILTAESCSFEPLSVETEGKEGFPKTLPNPKTLETGNLFIASVLEDVVSTSSILYGLSSALIVWTPKTVIAVRLTRSEVIYNLTKYITYVNILFFTFIYYIAEAVSVYGLNTEFIFLFKALTGTVSSCPLTTQLYHLLEDNTQYCDNISEFEYELNFNLTKINKAKRLVGKAYECNIDGIIDITSLNQTFIKCNPWERSKEQFFSDTSLYNDSSNFLLFNINSFKTILKKIAALSAFRVSGHIFAALSLSYSHTYGEIRLIDREEIATLYALNKEIPNILLFSFSVVYIWLKVTSVSELILFIIIVLFFSIVISIFLLVFSKAITKYAKLKLIRESPDIKMAT
jgi:hypothetical protein